MTTQNKIINNGNAPRVSKLCVLADDAATTNSNVGNAIIEGAYTNMIMVGVTSPVAVVYYDGSTETLPALIAGQWHWVAPVKNVQDTGTTTTDVHIGVSFNKG